MSTLAEDLYLLALDEVMPTYPTFGMGLLNVAVIAALVGELSLWGRVLVSPVTVRLLDAALTDDEILDDILRVIGSTPYLWSPHELLNFLCVNVNLSHVERRIIDRLVANERVRRTPNGMFATRQWPLPPNLQTIYDRRNSGGLVSPDERERLSAHMQRPRRAMLVQRIRAVLLKGDACDAACKLLISIACAAHLFARVYPKADLALMLGSLRALTKDEPLGIAVRQAHWYRPSGSEPIRTGPPWRSS